MNKDKKVANHVATQLQRCGFAVIGRDGDNVPDYAHTVGLADHGLPEIIVFGPPAHVLGEILHALGHMMIDQKKSFTDGEVFTGASGEPVAFKDVVNTELAGDLAEFLYEHYDGTATKPRLMQLVLSDHRHLLPWQEGFDQDYLIDQSLLWQHGIATALPADLIPPGVIPVLAPPGQLH